MILIVQLLIQRLNQIFFAWRALIPDSRPRLFLSPASDRVPLQLSRCSAFPSDQLPRAQHFRVIFSAERFHAGFVRPL